MISRISFWITSVFGGSYFAGLIVLAFAVAIFL